MEENVIDYNKILFRIHNDIFITALFLTLGYVFFLLVPILLPLGMKQNNSGIVIFAFFLWAISLPTAAGPLLWHLFKTGKLSAMFYREDYEVITTHSSGFKTSDNGAQSFALNSLFGIFLLIFLVFFGFLYQLIKLSLLSIRYFIFYIKTTEKPTFFNSAFPFMLLLPTIVSLTFLFLMIFTQQN